MQNKVSVYRFVIFKVACLLLIIFLPFIVVGADLPQANPVDLKDGYRSQGRWVPLYRADGEWALGAPEAVAEKLPDNLATALEAGVVTSDNSLIRRQQKQRLGQSYSTSSELQMLRNYAGNTAINPVFVNPTSRLRQIAGKRLIVRLKRGVEPEGLFSQNCELIPFTKDQYILTFENKTAEELFTICSQLDDMPEVLWAEPDFQKEWQRSYIPDDPLFAEQWHLSNAGLFYGTNQYSPANADIGAPLAWDRELGSSNIIVAIMDDGVESDHPDLIDNMALNPAEINGTPGVDDDGNGYIDDVLGWDFIRSDNNADPELSSDNHGTAVAGLAAAFGNNGTGVTGVAPNCRLLPIKLFRGNSFVSDSVLANAIRYAAGLTTPNTWRGADVINMSFGGGAPAMVINDALTDAATLGRNGKGCILVAASGNSATAYKHYYTNVGPGTYCFEWQYRKDYSFSAGEDCARLGFVILPDGTVARFDSQQPPVGWNLKPNSDAGWYIEDNPARAYGMGRYQLRSQAIQNNRTATLRSPSVTITASNTIYFACAVSSEASGDYIAFRIVKYSQPEPSFTNFASGITAIDPYVTYPANHPAVIAVGASTEFDYRSDFSQFGDELDVVAPGGGGITWIMTTDRAGAAGESNFDYNDDFGGTSASTPITSGAVALLLSRHPDLSAQQARTLLRKTAKKIGSVPYNETGEANCGGFNQYYGYGRLDVGRMLWLARVAFVAGHGGAVSKPVNAGPFYYDPGAVLEASAVTNVYYKFDQWVSAPAAAATIYHPFMTNSLIAVYDDTTITANFDQLLAAMGTPLEWLAYYGLTSPSFDEAEASDDDGDGHNAFQEWQAGTNPTDGGSVLRITNWERLPDERYVINWQTVSNRVYSLIAYDNPSATNGTTIASGILPTPPMNVFTTAPLSTATRFIHASTSFQ